MKNRTAFSNIIFNKMDNASFIIKVRVLPLTTGAVNHGILAG